MKRPGGDSLRAVSFLQQQEEDRLSDGSRTSKGEEAGTEKAKKGAAVLRPYIH
jgi:hypothetical protein